MELYKYMGAKFVSQHHDDTTEHICLPHACMHGVNRCMHGVNRCVPSIVSQVYTLFCTMYSLLCVWSDLDLSELHGNYKPYG